MYICTFLQDNRNADLLARLEELEKYKVFKKYNVF